MALWQLHHQFKDDSSEMCSQREIEGHEDFKRFLADTEVSHPLPEGVRWLMVPEDSPRFWMMAVEGGKGNGKP